MKDKHMKILKSIGLVFMVSAMLGNPLWAESSTKKNVVLIICDDLGVGDVGCYYAKDNPTPFLDKLSKSGLVHKRFYTTVPSCSPSRAALLTGKDARVVGVNRVLMGTNKHALSKSALTLGGLFKNNGYETGYIGKWHLGYGEDHDPLNYGFDYFFGHRGGKIDYFKYTDSAQKYKYDLWENKTPAQADGYCTTKFSQKSAQFIADHANTPFFLYVSLNAPHWDNEMNVPAPKEYMATLGPNPTKREIYVGAMRAIDDCVKEITETLRQGNLIDNTIFIFTSDQGAWQLAGGSNGPLRGFKGNNSFLEGGMRIPFIMRWPGREEATKRISKPANLLDVFPTLAANLDLKYDAGGCYGSDLFSPERRPIYAFTNNKNMIHHEEWKYVEVDNKQRYLFNLANDPFEKKNLITAESAKAAEFARLLAKYKVALAQQKSSGDKKFNSEL